MLQLGAYIHLHRARTPTGVGKHIIHMLGALEQRGDVELSMLVPEDLLAGARAEGYTDLPDRLATRSLPIRRAWLERRWRFSRGPSLSRWWAGGDWIYCPFEVPARSSRTPVATTMHGIHWFDPDYPGYSSWSRRKDRLYWRSILRPMLRRSRLVFTVSNYLRGRAIELVGADPERTVVVGNGVERCFYDAAERPVGQGPLSAERPYLLVIGGLSDIKGGDRILGLARRLAEDGRELKIVVAGRSEPPYDAQIEQTTHIRSLGYVDSERLAGMARDAVALLHLTRYDTFGIPCAEAMAAGTPVIAANHSSLPEVIGGGGVLVEGDDLHAVCDAVAAIDGETEYRERLATQALEEAKRHTWEACAARVVDALRRFA